MTEQGFDAGRLAASYRRLVLWFGVQLVVGLLGPVVAVALGDTALALLFEIAQLVVILVTIAALTLYAYRTAVALRSSVGVLWAVAMLVPLVNLITLLVLSSKATSACRAAGIPVGFLGPKLESTARR